MEQTSRKPMPITVFGGLLLVVIVGFLAHMISANSMTFLMRELLGSLHAPGFAGVTFLAVWIIRAGSRSRRPYLLGAIFSLSLAVISEASQVFTFRDSDIMDLGADILGIVTGLVVIGLFYGDIFGRSDSVWIRRITYAVAAALCFAVTFPTIDRLYAVFAQQNAGPSLATFESRWEKRLYADSLENGLKLVLSPHKIFGPGRRTALLDFAIPHVAGLALTPSPDWSGFRYVSFTAASATSTPQKLGLRIFDKRHNGQPDDRYVVHLDVPVEPTAFRIPLADIELAPVGRKTDLNQIQSMVFFSRSPRNEKIYIDNIRLE